MKSAVTTHFEKHLAQKRSNAVIVLSGRYTELLNSEGDM
jgi:hypothetical protein